MEIKNIVIENYGGIKSLKLPDLKFLALVGPNGSGKSTIFTKSTKKLKITTVHYKFK